MLGWEGGSSRCCRVREKGLHRLDVVDGAYPPRLPLRARAKRLLTLCHRKFYAAECFGAPGDGKRERGFIVQRLATIVGINARRPARVYERERIKRARDNDEQSGWCVCCDAGDEEGRV